jgi:hypothetical protein
MNFDALRRWLRPRRAAGTAVEAVAAEDAARSGLALISANFGGIDPIRPFPAQAGIHAYYYTDAERVADTPEATLASWTRVIVPDYPRHDFGPRLRGRYFKHQIHRLPEAEPYRWLAWADANVEFHDVSFLTGAVDTLAALAPHQRVALIPHPERATVRQEYEHIDGEIARGNEYLRLRYAQEKMTEQIDYFIARGWNPDAKLWCGTVWLIENSEPIRRCWDAWWDQNLRYGMMDQLSLPVLLEVFGLEPQSLGFSLTHNPYFGWAPHRVLM